MSTTAARDVGTREPTRRRDAEENRAGIIAAAMTVLGTDPAASIDTIAKAAGLSRRALYGHFEDRDALLAEVIAAGAERFNLIAVEAPELPAPLALTRLAADLWRAAEHVQASAAIALDDHHVDRTAAALAPLRATLRAIVTRGRADGVFRADVLPDVLARLVEEAARAVITRMRSTGDTAEDLAMRAVLSIAGLGWREVDTVVNEHRATERHAAGHRTLEEAHA